MDRAVQYIKRIYLRMKYARYGWRGNYASWREAKADCTGYDAGNIVEKVRQSAMKVKNGDAVYERDAMLFSQIEYSWPLLANLLWIAGNRDNQLSVLDLGGSLGTTYFQTRRYLQHLQQLRWSIVEQPDFVKAGKANIAGGQLDFFETVEAAVQAGGAQDVLLLSCVLPYVEKPFELLREMAAKSFPFIIVDNTYFNNKAWDRLTVQRVPPVYYDASYPAWFLNYDAVTAALQSRYDLIAAYENDSILYLEGEKIQYRGFVMKLKASSG